MERILLASRSAGVLDAGGLAPASFDAAAFRSALGRFATGVAFVTAAPDVEPTEMIVNSLVSVSLEPPLVSFCPARSSLTWSRMRRTGRFGVNVLARHLEAFAMRATPPQADRFADLDWDPGSIPRATIGSSSAASTTCGYRRSGIRSCSSRGFGGVTPAVSR